MDFFTDLRIVLGKNGLLVCIDKFSKFWWSIPIFMGKGELTAK